MARKAGALLVALTLAAAACSSGDAAAPTTAVPTTATPTTAAPTASTASPSTTVPTAPTTTTATTTTEPATTLPASSTTVTTAPPTSEAGGPVEIISAEVRNYESDDPPLSVLIGVPALQGLSNTTIQQSVNDSLRAIVTAAEEAFIADVTSYVEDVPATPEAPVSSIDIFYDVRYLTPELLSVRFESSTYFQGAANPGQAVQTFNIDLTTGDEVHLPDLFTGSEWGFVLDTLLREVVTEQVYGGDAALLDGWVDADALVISQYFTFSDSGLEFSFQEFEIGPGVLGAPTVTLPYPAMGVYIDPDGPIPRVSHL